MSGALVAVEPYRRAVDVVARHQGLQPRDILRPRGHRRRRARQLAVYLAVVAADLPGRRVAAAAGLSQSTLREALLRLEERRDDPAFDEFLSRLEEELTCL